MTLLKFIVTSLMGTILCISLLIAVSIFLFVLKCVLDEVFDENKEKGVMGWINIGLNAQKKKKEQ